MREVDGRIFFFIGTLRIVVVVREYIYISVYTYYDDKNYCNNSADKSKYFNEFNESTADHSRSAGLMDFFPMETLKKNENGNY